MERPEFNDISLLYPDVASSVRSSSVADCAHLSPSTVEQLEFPILIDLHSSDIGSFFSSDENVLSYRQEMFRDMVNNPSLPDVLMKMIPVLEDITELRRLGSDSTFSPDAYLYSITEVELYSSLLKDLQDGLKTVLKVFEQG